MTPKIASFGRQLAILAAGIALVGAGVAVAAQLSGEDNLLQQSWAKMQTASLYAKWKSQNKVEAAKLEAYWATGGTAPSLATAFGQALVLEAQAYWSLRSTTTTVGTTTITTPTTTTAPTTTAPPPPPPTGFPNATNTGVPAGTNLTAYTGPNPITADNTVIDGKEAGCLTIKATNVTIKNSYLHGNGCAVLVPEDPAVCVSSSGGACTVTIIDSTLSCNNAGGTAVYYRDYTVIRANVSGCENGFDASANVSVRDTYVHDLWQGSGAHTDDMQLSGGHVNHAFNVTVDHSYFDGLDSSGRTINSAIISNGGSGDTNIVFQNNLFGGGGYTLYCTGWGGGTPGPNDKVINNQLKNNYTFGHFDGCTNHGGLVVSGNTEYPSGNPIGPG